MKIYNTLTRTKQEFVPINDGKVGIYVCGPTVYGPPHVGHAKSYVNFDTVVRYFRYLGYKVKYVQNITDVGHLVGDGDEGEDKIARQAKREQLDAYEIAYKYETEYFNAMDALNVSRPSISCRATGFVYDMIETVKTILAKGYAYVTDQGNVYFDVYKYQNYGQLSNRKLDKNLSGERIEIADDKKHPEDFALWKSVPKDALMKWDSPWGVGCPGWHIECTTLGKKFLGDRFDIHGGGIDNIFPHHECECAQADITLGHLPMNYFMHNGLVMVDGVKMGKSLGNFITIPDLLKKYNPMAVRLFIHQFQYRSAVNFSEEGLLLAQKQFEKLEESINVLRAHTSNEAQVKLAELVEIKNNFENAMNEDFNTPLALVEVNKFNKVIANAVERNNADELAQVNTLVHGLLEDVLGLVFKKQEQKKTDDVNDEIKKLAEQRWQAKQAKDWAVADELRNKLLGLGYEIKDNKDGYEIIKK